MKTTRRLKDVADKFGVHVDEVERWVKLAALPESQLDAAFEFCHDMRWEVSSQLLLMVARVGQPAGSAGGAGSAVHS